MSETNNPIPDVSPEVKAERLRQTARAAIEASQTEDIHLILSLGAILWLSEQDEADWQAAVQEAADEAGVDPETISIHVAVRFPDGLIVPFGGDGSVGEGFYPGAGVLEPVYVEGDDEPFAA
jgi:hypothetical protein